MNEVMTTSYHADREQEEGGVSCLMTVNLEYNYR